MTVDTLKAERCCRLLARLNAGDVVSTVGAARDFGISVRSVERDLEVVGRVLPIAGTRGQWRRVRL